MRSNFVRVLRIRGINITENFISETIVNLVNNQVNPESNKIHLLIHHCLTRGGAKMSKSSDPRRVIGAHVYAKASIVTSDSECKRLFGSLWKKTTVNGIVKHVVVPPRGSGKQTSLIIKWNINGSSKTKEVKLMNVRIQQTTPSSSSALVQPSTSTSSIEAVIPSENTAETTNDQTEIGNTQVVSAAPHEQAEREEGVTCHGLRWIEADVNDQINGGVPHKHWWVSHITGARITEGHGVNGLSPYDYFMWMFPISHLGEIVAYTNIRLARMGKTYTTSAEILKFFGVLILLTRFEFGSRRDLWLTKSKSKYIAAPDFSRFIARHRFDTIRSCIRFGSYPLDDSHDESRWCLVDDFVGAINDHRKRFVHPSEYICVDESMSRWYGLGGDWIDVGLPTYRAIDRKPENGCEIKTSACGRSGIMLRLEIVKSPDEDSARQHSGNMNHGTAVTRRLIDPWIRTDRIVCADSYFASAETAQVLADVGTRFIGVVKTASRGYPMTYLSSKPMAQRGDHFSMVCKSTNGGKDMMSLLWVDRERRYFIATTGSTLPGQTIYRERWRRIGNATKKVITETRITDVCQQYYSAASQIDRHNRCRQDDLKLEKKFEVHEWSMRVNTSLLAICIVDAWLLYKGGQGSRDCMSPNEFYSTLAEQLIDNKYCTTFTRSQDVQADEVSSMTMSGIGPHLTPTNRKRKRSDGSMTNCSYQGRCTVCKGFAKSKYVCSHCTRDISNDVWICHSSTGRDCFRKHLRTHHVDMDM